MEKAIIDLLKRMEKLAEQVSILWKVFTVIGVAFVVELVARVMKLI
jgi:hypothetical protein